MKHCLPIFLAGAAWAAFSLPGTAQNPAPGPAAGVSAVSLFEEAKALQSRGLFGQALAKCSKALEADPKLMEGWLLHSRLLRERGALDKALDSCGKVLELDAKNFPARLLRGNLLKDAKQYEPALKLAQELLDELPELSLAWALMGELRLQMGEPEAALANFDQAVETGKKEVAAYSGRALARIKVGSFYQAGQDLDQAIALNNKDASLWMWRGIVRLWMEEETGAEEDLTQAMKLGSRDVRTFLYRGQLRLSQKKWKEALEDLSEARDLDPDNLDVLIYRSDARYQLDDFSGAVMDLQRAVALKPEDAALHSRLAEACFMNHDDEAAVHFSEAIRIAPGVARYWIGRGMFRLAEGELASGLEDMDRGLKLDPDQPEALIHRARALLDAGRFQEARTDCDRVLKLESGAKDGWAHFLRGQAGLGLGDLPAAVIDLDLATGAGKAVPRAELWYWLALTRSGQTEKAQSRIQAHADQVAGERTWEGGPTGTAQFLAGKTTEDVFLKAIESAHATRAQWDRMRECYYFAGIQRLTKGDKAGAAAHFRRCLENPDKPGLEFHLAQQELKRLEGKKPEPSKETEKGQ